MYKEILRMEQIVTYSKDNMILKNAKLNLFEGEVVGIVGVNYCGKTALVGGITGLLPYDSGKTLIYDQPVRITSIAQATNYGIFYIQPTSTLIPSFSVSDNIFLTTESKRNIQLDRKNEKIRTRELLDMLGSSVDEDEFVENLPNADRIVVEICKAIARDAKIIIFDNVISALAPGDFDQFHFWMEIMKTLHIGVILIEARIKPLKPFCSRLFVIRDGQTVGVIQNQMLDENKIISLMLGYPLTDEKEPYFEDEIQGKENLISIKNVYFDNILKNLSFDIYKNEILGILNVNKYSGKAIERVLSGLAKIESGEIIMGGEPVHFSCTEDAWLRGVAVIPEDDLLLMDFSLEDNITLSALKKNSFMSIINKAEIKYIKDELIEEYITGQNWLQQMDHYVPDGWLLQKKIAFCRALASSPKLMVLTNPTQRIDYISKQKMYEDIISLKKKGISALIISTNIHELVSVCERIIVVKEGQVRDVLAVNEESKDGILMKYGKYLKDV